MANSTNEQVKVRVTRHISKGTKQDNENICCVVYDPADGQNVLYSFFAIFEGRGGNGAANYAHKHLHDNIVSQKNFWEKDENLVKKAIHDGFMNTHHMMSQLRGTESATNSPTSRTTVAVAIIKDKHVYTAHVGDCRMVLGTGIENSPKMGVMLLSLEHTPKEIGPIRVIPRGHPIPETTIVNKVQWASSEQQPSSSKTEVHTTNTSNSFLSITPSSGDCWTLSSENCSFVLSPIPHIISNPIDTLNRCLVLATVSVWQVIHVRDAVKIVLSTEEQNAQKRAAGAIKELICPSKTLVEAAKEIFIKKHASFDDIGAIVIIFEPPETPCDKTLPRNEPNGKSTDEDQEMQEVDDVTKMAVQPS